MKVIITDLKFFFTLFFLSFLLLFIDKLGILDFPKFLLQQVTVPIQYGLYKSGQSWNKQLESFLLVRRASLENRALRVQLGELLTENALLRNKLAETESLVDQYNKLNPRTYDTLPARVIASDRFLLIDKGVLEGVKVGQVVVYKDNYIGQIKEVTPATARVMVVQDPDSKITVFSQNSSGRAKGMILGQFGSAMLMDKILHQEVISKDDLVYSEGVEGSLPRGLIIGRVEEVLERQNELFKQAKIEPVFNLHDIDVVFIIRTQ